MVIQKNNPLKSAPAGRGKYFFTALLFYLIFVTGFIFLVKNIAGEYILKEVDRRLLMTARSLPIVIPEDFHDRALNPESIKKREWMEIQNKLTSLADSSGVVYVWSDIKVNEKVFLTACNRTKQGRQTGLEIYFFMPYKEGVSKEEMSAFAGNDPVFTDFSDRWGNFRAVFIPCTSPGGRRYLACAEYTVDYVNGLLRKSVLISLFVALGFFAAFLPLFFILIRNYRNGREELQNQVKTLEKRERNIRVTLDSIGDGVIVTDQRGLITIMNPAAEKLTGWKAEDAYGKLISEGIILKNSETDGRIYYHPESFTEYKKSIRPLKNKVIISSDGTEKNISESVSLIRNTTGELLGVVIIFRDITEYKKHEDEQRKLLKLETIGHLAGELAHDFNNMLGAIMGSAELLLIHLKDNELLRNYGETILNASEKAAVITHKLLAFSRKGKNKNESVDIHKAVDNTVTILKGIVCENIEIFTSRNAQKSIVTGDNTLIENAILNIGINSGESMPNGGVIKIETGNIYLDREYCEKNYSDVKPGNYIEIKISDNGTGISEENRKKIFEPFFTTRDPGKGSGLGLAAVYLTVKEHNGIIKFESETGKGTIFTIYLPLMEQTHESEPNTQNYAYKGEGLVLIIDDEELLRDSAAGLLRNMSYEVITAADGQEGIEAYKKYKGKISLVILDMIMPKMGGRETFMKLRELNPSLTVIISSGFSCDNDSQELLKSGAAGFIQKPYKSSELAYTLMTIDKRNKLSRSL